MREVSHQQARHLILSRSSSPQDPDKREMEAHLSSCLDCREFAGEVSRQAALLRETLHQRWDLVADPAHVFETTMVHPRRHAMIRSLSSFQRTLVWAGGLLLLVVVLLWAIPCLALGKTCPTLPAFRVPLSSNPITAQEIMPGATDLGAGWIQTAEKNDMNASYYFDLDQNGYPIIGTHTTYTATLVQKDQIESVSMRGFAQPEQGWTLFSSVMVFKDESQAEAFAKGQLQNMGYDSDIPREQYTTTQVTLGDEAKMVSIRETPEATPWTIMIAFRKGRVMAALFSMGLPAEAGLSPEQVHPIALSEEQMLEIGRLIEARIP